MLWHPWKVAVLGIVAWLAVRFLAPIEGIVPLSSTALWYIVACYLAFFTGCAARALSQPAVSPNRKSAEELWRGAWPPEYFWTIFAIGLAGVAMRLYDRIVVRGASLTLDIAEIRDTLADSQSSLFGALGGFLSPFAFLPLIMLFLKQDDEHRFVRFSCSILLFILPVADAARQGSRSVMLVAVALLVFAIALTRFEGKLLHRRLFYPAVGLVAGLAVASTVIFSARLSSHDRDLRDAVFNAVFAQSIGPNYEARLGIMSDEPAVSEYYRIVVPNALYFTSGVYEFSRLWDRPDRQVFSWGTNFIYPYTRVANSILRLKRIPAFLQPDDALFFRSGVFTTLFGPLWVEWGYLGAFMMFLFGFLLTGMSLSIRDGKVHLVPLYACLMAAVLYAMVVNIMALGFGFFSLNAFILFALLQAPQASPRMSERQSRHRLTPA